MRRLRQLHILTQREIWIQAKRLGVEPLRGYQSEADEGLVGLERRRD